MKIAVFTDLYEPSACGGIISSIKAQKAALEALGHEVIVFCPGFQEEVREKNVIAVPSHRWLRVNGAVFCKRPGVVEDFILEKIPDFASFDLVHVHYEAGCSIAGVRLAQKFNLPLVQTMHGREDMAIMTNVPHPAKYATASLLCALHRHYLGHMQKVRRDQFQAPTYTRAKMWTLMVNHADQADMVITPSDHFAKKLEHYGVSKPVVPVSNGVPDELTKMKVMQRTLEDGAVLKMIWNSRCSKEKRLLSFLQALVGLKRPYLVYVYGDGNELKKAKKFAEKNHLKVKFYGAVKREKIFARMREAHLGIMASYNFDTQGMTLLEAEAVGLPVFFCDPAMMEVVPRGSYVMADGVEAGAMMIALENTPASEIGKMSKVMLSHREDAAQSKQLVRLLKVYKTAITNHAKQIK